MDSVGKKSTWNAFNLELKPKQKKKNRKRKEILDIYEEIIFYQAGN